ncbi:unnamed protein product (mitochondrion) [Plasmodiophora brassicae]|uniref:Uncharacterized protein n=1 Tax=Plasmodiophora brassicae TaxID=37360 RepID=A0A0G4IXR4_PLABS|nr:hypothetical protein PBRA_007832 [Plasmodiophora brassicae]SPR00222.1 unnamed protein product [Plasmodiophora brassicae]
MSRAAASIVVVFVVAVLAMAADNLTGEEGGAASKEARELEQKLELTIAAKKNKLEEIRKATDKIEEFDQVHKNVFTEAVRCGNHVRMITLLKNPSAITHNLKTGKETIERSRRIPQDVKDRMVAMIEEYAKLHNNEIAQELEKKIAAMNTKLKEFHEAIDAMVELSQDHKDQLKNQLKAGASRGEFMKVLNSLTVQLKVATTEDGGDKDDEEQERIQLNLGEFKRGLLLMFEEVDKQYGEIARIKERQQPKKEDLRNPRRVPVPGQSGGSMTAIGATALSGAAVLGAGTIGYHAVKESSLKKGWNKVIGYLRKPDLSKVPAGAVPSPEPRSTPMTVGKVAGAAAAATAAITGAGTLGYFAYRENGLAKGWNKAVEKTKKVANTGLQTLGLQKKPVQTPPETTSSATGAIVSVGAVVACAFAALA